MDTQSSIHVLLNEFMEGGGVAMDRIAWGHKGKGSVFAEPQNFLQEKKKFWSGEKGEKEFHRKSAMKTKPVG